MRISYKCLLIVSSSFAVGGARHGGAELNSFPQLGFCVVMCCYVCFAFRTAKEITTKSLLVSFLQQSQENTHPHLLLRKSCAR